MWNLFQREKMSVVRIEAPDALKINDCRAYRNEGARACAAGHRLMWRQARLTTQEHVMIFEDDVMLCRRFEERLGEVRNVLPENWMVVYLGCVFQRPPEMVSPGLLRVSGPTWASTSCRSSTFTGLHP